MADSKLTELDALAAPIGTDILYIVDDPGGTPAQKKITLANLLAAEYMDLTALDAVSVALLDADIAMFLSDGSNKKATIQQIKAAVNCTLNPTTITNLSWQGPWFFGTAGETIAVGKLCYYDATAGEFLLTNADDAASMPAQGLCVAAGTDGNPVGLLNSGWFRNTSWSLTPGALLYASDSSDGDMTETAPSTAEHQVQVVGWALTSSVIRFQPNFLVVEIAS